MWYALAMEPVYCEHHVIDGYERLRALRDAAGLSQAEMAERIGVSLRLYEELEANGTAVLEQQLNAAQLVARNLEMLR